MAPWVHSAHSRIWKPEARGLKKVDVDFILTFAESLSRSIPFEELVAKSEAEALHQVKLMYSFLKLRSKNN